MDPELRRPIIETERQTACPLCRTAGETIYDDLRDPLFGASGVWGIKQCPECAALWLDPRPTRASIGEAYKTYFTHGSTKGPAAIYNAAIRLLARERAARVYGVGRPTPGLSQICSLATSLHGGLADQADLLIRHLSASDMGSEARLLDVGCGDGEALAFLCGIGWQGTGVEIDPAAVRAARARGLDVIEGTIQSADLADNSFDAVTSSHVIEHVHDPKAFLDEARRVLKPGGVLVAVTPNARSELLTRHGRDWLALDPPRHLVLFNADNIGRLASDAGFREVQVKRTARLASFSHIASAAISTARADTSRRGSRFGLWFEAKALEARMIRNLRRGSAEGDELVLIARK